MYSGKQILTFGNWSMDLNWSPNVHLCEAFREANIQPSDTDLCGKIKCCVDKPQQMAFEFQILYCVYTKVNIVNNFKWGLCCSLKLNSFYEPFLLRSNGHVILIYSKESGPGKTLCQAEGSSVKFAFFEEIRKLWQGFTRKFDRQFYFIGRVFIDRLFDSLTALL